MEKTANSPDPNPIKIFEAFSKGSFYVNGKKFSFQNEFWEDHP